MTIGGIARLQGQSSLRTWLIAILNHKIQDIFRRETRYVSISSDNDEHEPFDHFGLDVADESTDPMRAVASARMRAALEREIEVMPTNLKAVSVNVGPADSSGKHVATSSIAVAKTVVRDFACA